MVKMKHYEGVLGNFDYDAAQFKVTREPRSNSEYLKYIGKENDGSRIVIPNGVVDAYRMFDGSSINSMPEIPLGIAQLVEQRSPNVNAATNIRINTELSRLGTSVSSLFSYFRF